MPRKRAGWTSVSDQVRSLVTRDPSGLVTQYGALAEQLDVAEDLVREAVVTLKSEGHIHVHRAGRQGVRLVAVNAAAATGPASTTSEPPTRRSASGARFCPWCGNGAEKDWQYCTECGKSLPNRD